MNRDVKYLRERYILIKVARNIDNNREDILHIEKKYRNVFKVVR